MGLGFSAVGIFGKLPFLCSSAVTFTFKDLSVSRSARWATHEIIGKKPVLEYIGPGLTEVSFNIQLNSMLGTPPLTALIQLKKCSRRNRRSDCSSGQITLESSSLSRLVRSASITTT